MRGTISEALNWVNENEIRGEFCVILEGNVNGEVEEEEAAYWTNLSIVEHIDHLVEENK